MYGNSVLCVAKHFKHINWLMIKYWGEHLGGQKNLEKCYKLKLLIKMRND